MSLLEHAEAEALLADAEVTAATVRGCRHRLGNYLPRFYRQEQRELAEVVLHGKLSKLERKTAEPIASLAGRERKPVQHFVGAGAWDDQAVMAELRRHVAQELADADGVFILDGSGFPKRGEGSCGVARQWCGRPGVPNEELTDQETDHDNHHTAPHRRSRLREWRIRLRF